MNRLDCHGGLGHRTELPEPRLLRHYRLMALTGTLQCRCPNLDISCRN